jgi:hypothetical protein
MKNDGIIRRLRGALGTALVWGASWSATALAVFAVLKLGGVFPASASWLGALVIAAKFGIIGGIAGGAFSGFVGLAYRGRRLSEISALRFGFRGGMVAAVFVPAFLQAMNLLSGDGLVPMGLVLDDGVWAALFGAVAAGGSLKLAQHAEPLLSGRPRSGLLAGGNPLASAGARDLRSHAPSPRPRFARDDR